MADKETKISEQQIVIQLLDAGILGVNYFRHLYNTDNEEIQPHTLCLFIVCNDLFFLGAAESEIISNEEELRSLYEAYANDSYYGVDFWCCKKANMQPHPKLKEIWKNNGVWNDELESLKENPYKSY